MCQARVCWWEDATNITSAAWPRRYFRAMAHLYIRLKARNSSPTAMMASPNMLWWAALAQWPAVLCSGGVATAMMVQTVSCLAASVKALCAFRGCDVPRRNRATPASYRSSVWWRLQKPFHSCDKAPRLWQAQRLLYQLAAVANSALNRGHLLQNLRCRLPEQGQGTRDPEAGPALRRCPLQLLCRHSPSQLVWDLPSLWRSRPPCAAHQPLARAATVMRGPSKVASFDPRQR